MSMRTVLALVAAAFTLFLCSTTARTGEPEHELPPELRAEVPALMGLHESIFELWHGAWPERDTTRMKELLPAVEQQVAAVVEAELPGILRDKQDAWEAGVGALQNALDDFRTAAAASSDDGLVAAVEDLHARFEGLIRIIRPVMPELQDFHVVLYNMYHYDLPEQDYAAVAERSVELQARCDALLAAPVPSRFAALSDRLGERVAALCAATSSLRSSSADDADGKAVAAAVEAVHGRYQEVEALFD